MKITARTVAPAAARALLPWATVAADWKATVDSHLATVKMNLGATDKNAITNLVNLMDQAIVTGNQATATQTRAQGSSASIRQDGSGNVATSNQHGGAENAVSFNLTANINQTGNSNTAGIDQSGLYNDASITQNGSANVATIGQSGIGASDSHNSATISQTGFGHNASITQSGGAGNHAAITQN